MIKVIEESLDTTSWSQYLREASKGIAESSVRNDPNLGLMIDIDPSRKGIDKAIDNILDLGFKKVDEYIEEVTGDHDSDSYYVFTKGSSEDDRVVMGIVFQLDNFAFINVRYDEIEDADYFNESKDTKIESTAHTDGEYTVAIAKKKLGGLDKGRLVHYFIDDVTIFCYVSANRESWICNLDVDQKDEYLRDLSDEEYNELCSIGKNATSTADASRMQNEYRLSLVEEIDYADVFGDQSNIYSEDELDDFLYDLAEECGLDSDDLYDELVDKKLISTYDIDRDTGVPLTFHYDPEAIKSYVSKKCESNGIKVEEVEDEYEPWDVFKGKKYYVSGSISNYPGEISSMSKPVVTNDPKEAIIAWFKINKKYPMDTDISTQKKAYAKELWQYASENEDWIRELCAKYKCHMKPDYMVSAINKCLNRDYFHESDFGDQIHPFDVG